ncbi:MULTISPECIES: hypothetical protein [unclassified Pseudonocardia]|uniref:hypothetical protein n=1 Tax=Pseudonocardia sp. Ae150A_Ps1 TaxID=1885028 RepID=UPI00201626A6|nr:MULTISPECIES: hypothetical protein [unclassified Pseudonocardia]
MPGPGGQDQPADQRAEDRADREHAGEGGERAVAVAAVVVRDDPVRGRQHHPAGDALQEPQPDQRADRPGDRAQAGEHGERGDGDEEGAPAAEAVGEPPAERQGEDLADGVDGDDPAGPGEVDAEVAADGGQRGRHRGLVLREHQQRDRDHGEHDVPPGVRGVPVPACGLDVQGLGHGRGTFLQRCLRH